MIGLKRHSLFGLAVLSATGVPYALSQINGAGGSASRQWSDKLGASQSIEGQAAADPAAEFPALRSTERPIEGPGVTNLSDVFRYDATPSWVLGRWPRVMNSRYEDLQAYRVPLVTGAKDADLAGSLTYCFDAKQQVRQIRFQGTTGDARPLVMFLIQQHGFAHEPTQDPSEYLYQVKHSGQAICELRVKTAPLIESSAASTRFQVQLSMQPKPDSRWFTPATTNVDPFRWP